jgi:hypothetical protein
MLQSVLKSASFQFSLLSLNCRGSGGICQIVRTGSDQYRNTQYTLDHDQIAYFSRYCAQLDLLEWVYFQSCDEASLQSGAWRVPRDVAGGKVQSLGLTQLHEYLHHLTLQNIQLFYLLRCFFPQAPVALGGGKEKCLAFRRRGKWQGF